MSSFVAKPILSPNLDNDKECLLIAGYIRIIENIHKKLHIPNEIYHIIYMYRIHFILKLICCDKIDGNIDENKYIQRGFMQNWTLKALQISLQVELYEKNTDNLPDIHLWMKFKQIKHIYTINKKVKITLNDLSSHNPQKWMEIPDDSLEQLKFSDFDDDDFKVVVEQRNKNGVWPRAKHNDDWKNIELGDFIDRCTLHDAHVWYEAMVKYVYPKEHVDFGYIIVHYIGWNTKWNHKKLLTQNLDGIAKRNTHTNGPYINKVNHIKSSLNEATINVLYNGIRKEITFKPSTSTRYRMHNDHTMHNMDLKKLIVGAFEIYGLKDSFNIQTATGFKLDIGDIKHYKIFLYYKGDFVVNNIC